MKMLYLKKMLMPVLLAACLTACDSENNETQSETTNVQFPETFLLEDNSIYRVTLQPQGNQLPQIGVLSIDANGNKRLMLSDNKGMPSYSLEEKEGIWTNASDANLSANRLTIALVEPLEAVIGTADIQSSNYVTQFGNSSNVIFSVNAGTIIAAKSGECTLTGEIKAMNYPGLFQVNAMTDSCSNPIEIKNGVLAATIDETPASFKLVYERAGQIETAYIFES